MAPYTGVQIYNTGVYRSKHINNECFAQIWKPRCTITVAWEQINAITTADKRTYSANPHIEPQIRHARPATEQIRKEAKILARYFIYKSLPVDHYLNSSLKPSWKTTSVPFSNLIVNPIIALPIRQLPAPEPPP